MPYSILTKGIGYRLTAAVFHGDCGSVLADHRWTFVKEQHGFIISSLAGGLIFISDGDASKQENSGPKWVNDFFTAHTSSIVRRHWLGKG